MEKYARQPKPKAEARQNANIRQSGGLFLSATTRGAQAAMCLVCFKKKRRGFKFLKVSIKHDHNKLLVSDRPHLRNFKLDCYHFKSTTVERYTDIRRNARSVKKKNTYIIA